MTGEALHRAPEAQHEAQFPSLLELFAAVLTGRVRDDAQEEISALVARARSAARAATARIPLGREETLALRLIYKETRETRDPRAAIVPGDALTVLQQIPRRQRATVLLSIAFDMAAEEAAVVIGVRPTAVEAILNAGLASLSRIQEAGIDAARVLRVQARGLVARREPDSERQPTRLPRAVVRTLVAPVLGADEVPPPAVEESLHHLKPSPVEVLVAKTTPSPAPRPSTQRRIRPYEAVRKLALVAAIVTILLAVFLPASAGDRTPSAPAPSRPAQAAQRVFDLPAPMTLKPAVVVRPGDSLWQIAERRLGNPLRWPEIWRLNRGLEMTQGRRFVRPDLIHPGWLLRLPAR